MLIRNLKFYFDFVVFLFCKLANLHISERCFTIKALQERGRTLEAFIVKHEEDVNYKPESL